MTDKTYLMKQVYLDNNTKNYTLLVCKKCNTLSLCLQLYKTKQLIRIEQKCNNCLNSTIIPAKEFFNHIQTKSHCSMNPSHSCLKSVNYCATCSKWGCKQCIYYHQEEPNYSNHFLLTEIIGLTCQHHIKAKYTAYCNSCHRNICIECLNYLHFNHNYTLFDSLNQKLSITELKKAINIFNARLTEIKEKIDVLTNILDLKDETKLKADLYLTYESYKEKNQILLDILLLIFDNYSLLYTTPSYELLINTLIITKINTLDLIYDKEISIKNNCITYIDYLNSNNLIKITSFPQCVSTLSLNNNDPHCLIQLLNGLIVVSFLDLSIKVFSYAFLKSVVVHRSLSSIESLFQLNNSRLVYGSLDAIYILNISNWKKTQTLSHSNSGIICRIIQLNNETIACGSSKGQIIIWNIISYNKIKVIQEDLNLIHSLIKLKDERFISSSFNGNIRVYDCNTYNKQVYTLPMSNFIISILQLKDSTLILGLYDNMIIRLNTKPFTQIGQMMIAGKVILSSMIQLPDESVLCGTKKKLFIIDIEIMVVIKTIAVYDSYIRKFIYMADGTICSSGDNKIKIWNF